MQQVMLSLYLIKKNTVKHMGKLGHRDTSLDVVNGQFHVPADSSPGTEPLVPIRQDAKWTA